MTWTALNSSFPVSAPSAASIGTNDVVVALPDGSTIAASAASVVSASGLTVAASYTFDLSAGARRTSSETLSRGSTLMAPAVALGATISLRSVQDGVLNTDGRGCIAAVLGYMEVTASPFISVDQTDIDFGSANFR